MSGLDKAREAAAARRAAGLPVAERLDPIEKARRKPTSLRLAITAKCWGYPGDPSDGVRYCVERVELRRGAP